MLTLKHHAHNVFDRFWMNNNYIERKDAYKWLAHKLKIDHRDCHFSTMSQSLCIQAISICSSSSQKTVQRWIKKDQRKMKRNYDNYFDHIDSGIMQMEKLR